MYRPGDQHHLPRGTPAQYSMPNECWALELAQGIPPLEDTYGRMDPVNVTLWVVVHPVSHHGSRDVDQNSMVDVNGHVPVFSSRKVLKSMA